jgi:MoxR-like ATPase
MSITSKEMARLKSEFDLENYQPLSVTWHLRSAILTRLRNGEDVLPDIDGRQEIKSDLIRAVLSGSHPYLISEEGTGKTRLARSLSRLLPPVPAIKGCAYHDDPKWENYYLCNRCQDAKNPAEKFGIEFIPGEMRFSRVQGNEYTNEAKILGLKDIQAIACGASPSDPGAFIGTGIFRANRGILMVDELPAIRTKVQVLLHPLLEEKKAVLEEYNWERFVDLIVIATGNPSGFSHVNEIPRPLLDRLEMIYMDLPEEEIEKKIIMKERSVQDSNGYIKQNFNSEALGDPTVDYDLIKRHAVIPWWVIEVLNKTVRYSRQCANLEKKPSIRGGTRAFEHTLSSTEMEGRTVATLNDAFLGLRLALRGRIGLMPDYIDFDNPEKTIKQTDQVAEDMLRDVINDVSRKLFQEVDFNQERLVQEISATYGKDATDPSSVILKQSPELEKIIEWMVNSWQSKLPYRYCSQREKDIFDRKDEVADSIKKEYMDSALTFVTASAAVKGIVKDEMLSDKVFVPKRISFNM